MVITYVDTEGARWGTAPWRLGTPWVRMVRSRETATQAGHPGCAPARQATSPG